MKTGVTMKKFYFKKAFLSGMSSLCLAFTMKVTTCICNTDSTNNIKKFDSNEELTKIAWHSISKQLSNNEKPYIVSCIFDINSKNELLNSSVKTHYSDYRKKATRTKENYANKNTDSTITQTIEIVYKKTDKQNLSIITKDPLKKYLKKNSIQIRIPKHSQITLLAQNNLIKISTHTK